MKKEYVTPEVEYINFYSEEILSGEQTSLDSDESVEGAVRRFVSNFAVTCSSTTVNPSEGVGGADGVTDTTLLLR